MSKEFDYLGDPVSSKLFDITLQLATDLHVISTRVRTLEMVLQEKGVLGENDLEEFVPSAAQEAYLSEEREALLHRILRIVAESGPAEHPLRSQWEEQVESAAVS